MKKYALILILLVTAATNVFAQKYFTRSGHISFYSTAPLENIEAHNYQASSIMDVSTGDMAFSMLIKGFEFKKALMQEHFNEEKYMASDKYPKSTFEGKILNIKDINLQKDGKYDVDVEGDLTIRGVTKKVKTKGTITVNGGKVSAYAKFPVRLSDYNVSIPTMVKDNIAEVVDVTVAINYEEYKKN